MANLTQAAKYAPQHVPAVAYRYDPNPNTGGQFRVNNSSFASLDVVEESLKIHQQLLREAEANLHEAQANVRRAEANVLHLETILNEYAVDKQEQLAKNKQKKKEKEEIDRAGKKTAAKAKAKANSKGLDSSPELCSGPPSPSP